MEWVDLILEFIVDVLEAAAWPAALAYVVIKLRGELGTLITKLLGERLERLQAVGVTAEFTPQPQDAQAETEEATEVAERALTDVPEEVERIVELARRGTADVEEALDLLALQLRFERIHQHIYRSQMELLFHLEGLEGGGGSIDVEFHHRWHVKRAGEFALDEGSWLAFLYNTRFIEGNAPEDTLSITRLGTWYLAYCRAVGYPPNAKAW